MILSTTNLGAYYKIQAKIQSTKPSSRISETKG